MKWLESCSPDHLFLTMIEGLHAIHLSGFIHNDMKPNNVMVDVRGLHYNVVVIDFRKACPLHMNILQITKLPCSVIVLL